MKINDIIEGKGEEYILLTKSDGKYKIHTTSKTLKELVDELNQLLEKVKKVKK